MNTWPPNNSTPVRLFHYLKRDGKDRKAIGLATLQERLGLVGGKLEIESEENRGSTFRITLPVFNSQNEAFAGEGVE